MASTKDWSRIGPVTVHNITGWVKPFTCLDDAVRAIGRGNIDRLKYGRLGLCADPFWGYRHNKQDDAPQRDCSWIAACKGDAYVVRDELGLIVPVWRIKQAAEDLLDPAGFWRRRYQPHVFREGPVPNTRCHRGGYGYHRTIATTVERRANIALMDDLEARELGLTVRGRRRNIPTSWDDQAPTRYSHGWKRHRRTQYKTKETA